MQLTLREKLNIIVGAVAASFFVLMAVSWQLDSRMETQTAIIRDHFIPYVELGYRLETQFDGIALNLRDAVSAQDIGELKQAQESKDKLMHELDSAMSIVDSRQIAELKSAIDDYFSSAMETSTRLIKGETGLNIVEAMTRMQTKRALAAALMNKVTNFDRGKLSEAFASIYLVNERSRRIRFWVSLTCVIFIFSISSLTGKALIVRLKEISQGVARFGEGNFGQEISIVGQDELSDLSHKINMMAIRIQSLVREIESFSYSVAHDLRAPLRSVVGFSTALAEDHAQGISEEGNVYLRRIVEAGQRMGKMIDGLLGLSRLNRKTINKQQVNLSQIAGRIVELIKSNEPDRNAALQVEENVYAWGDPQLLDIVLANLIGNAWKFTKRNPETQIQFGSKKENAQTIFFVRDNGAGFDMRYSDKLFGTFQRLHTESEFEGHGIGLATVKNVIDKHGGRIWAESELNKGATFNFTLE
jgi:signal transduction histidine kinase